ncbi:MAG: YceI family protein [Gammaproteobacteria bacterium]|nr:YceI family protein [Gammaproteobacteria bacterium]MBU6509120.1 YceI family protein [Gammaproteobacteria bacterium]MDE1984113.1 YceI family protein [Gammaproteobacteria bacterium]MDE2108174.1 YceI family protein [Gammaproteobacteria bacterium]
MRLRSSLALPALASQAAAFSVLILGALVLTACQTVPAIKPPPVLAPLPPLPVQGTTHYSIRADLSDLRFLVYRAGPLASFGHNHVIRATQMQGDIYLGRDLQHSGFTLTLPVKDFQVDAPAARAVEGPDFAKQPSAQAIQGTYNNMLGAGELDATEYPDIRIRSVAFAGPEWQPDATVRIELHGVQRDLTVPIVLKRHGKQLIASGAFQIKQSDFGIRPFSILGGGLQVADTVKVSFHLVAQSD